MYKVLIADDEMAELMLLEKLVKERFGSLAETKSVSSGRLAHSIALLWSADLVLMDIEMPVVNGLEAARRILAEKEDCHIIFITAYPLFDYAKQAVSLGASDYILKPVEADELERVIRRVFSQIESTRIMKAEIAGLKAEGSIESAGKQELLMQKVSRYLQANYMNPALSVESVAELIGLSPSRLSTLFKQCMKMNFSDYVSDLRIIAARELLADPLRSANEVASLTGFESASYFTRVFKKRVGLTPTEYRKTLRGDTP